MFKIKNLLFFGLSVGFAPGPPGPPGPRKRIKNVWMNDAMECVITL